MIREAIDCGGCAPPVLSERQADQREHERMVAESRASAEKPANEHTADSLIRFADRLLRHVAHGMAIDLTPDDVRLLQRAAAALRGIA